MSTRFITLICLGLAIQSLGQGNPYEEIKNQLPPSIQIKGEPVKYGSMDERMEAYNVPGASVAIIHDGKLVYSEGFGIAREGVPVTTETLFQAGSISKPVAALAVMKLVDEGKVDLDTDVNEYLTSWKVPPHEFEESVTLRRLLTHTAGTTVHGFPGYKPTDTFPSDIEVLNGDGNTAAIYVDTEPGSLWRYSGGGYTIMERVVEDVSGMSFQEYMAVEILEPMGMTNSTYVQPLSEDRGTQASSAFNREGKLIEGSWHNYPEQAAAGLWTTPSDLATYALHIQGILKGNDGIISKEVVEQMLTKHDNDWGLGPGLAKEGDSLVFRHGGKNAGFTNMFAAFAYQGEGAIVMTNADLGGGLMNEFMMGISNYFDWNLLSPRIIEIVDIDPEVLKMVPGKYKYDGQHPEIGDYVITLALEEGELVLDDPNDNIVYHLLPMADMRFMDVEKNMNIRFNGEGENQTDSFIWDESYQFHRVND